MALSKDEFRNRAVAAAALSGLNMKDGGARPSLMDALEKFGADRTLYHSMLADQTKRGLPRNVRDLSEALGLPRAWFTEPDWRALIPGAEVPEHLLSDPEAEELETDLEGESQRSESNGPRTGEQEPGAQNG